MISHVMSHVLSVATESCTTSCAANSKDGTCDVVVRPLQHSSPTRQLLQPCRSHNDICRAQAAPHTLQMVQQLSRRHASGSTGWWQAAPLVQATSKSRGAIGRRIDELRKLDLARSQAGQWGSLTWLHPRRWFNTCLQPCHDSYPVYQRTQTCKLATR